MRHSRVSEPTRFNNIRAVRTSVGVRPQLSGKMDTVYVGYQPQLGSVASSALQSLLDRDGAAARMQPCS